ncbi:hypothetical protein EYF80_048795 [Liparis tanakae]|uniref:Uncharacterized protein n=1 Tax=Liparis tanakae TaxID=230148 RepID=A0A4Z2FIK3_9TELE|nr:hypothetical protein EYF80_048795 [Liparis tanakae]
MFKTANYPTVDPVPTIMHGTWFATGCRETPAALEQPKKKKTKAAAAFSLVKIMSLGNKKEHGQHNNNNQQQQQQQHQHHNHRQQHHQHNNNNLPFAIHCHIGKEIKHICSNCSRGADTQDGERAGLREEGGSCAVRRGCLHRGFIEASSGIRWGLAGAPSGLYWNSIEAPSGLH